MPMKMKSIKGIDLSCASPASTAICSSMDQRSVIKNSTKSLHRFNSYLGDHYKTITNTYSPSRAPCISELPFTPRPSSFSTYRDKTRKLASSAVNHTDVMTTRRRRSSADVSDIKRRHYSSSSRYLLGESRYLDSLSENENSKANCSSRPVFGSDARRSTRRFGSVLDDEKETIRKHFSLIDVGDDQRKQRNAGDELTCFDSQSQRHKSMGFSSTNDSLLHKPRSAHQVFFFLPLHTYFYNSTSKRLIPLIKRFF
ncbi:hypothetical protein RND81_04G168500 [Saponaria officinalis]|uniref:Uncharacterized protein n=1 Tax=Saponaria officinalis TaxID=3572 RepID=A0AAW1LF01_SAPOF